MAEGKTMRLSQAARKLNVGTATIVAYLVEQGIEVENKPHTKIMMDQFNILAKAFSTAVMDKEEASEIAIGESHIDTLPVDKAIKPTSKEKKAISMVSIYTNRRIEDYFADRLTLPPQA